MLYSNSSQFGCPMEFNCTSNLSSFDIGTNPTYASIVSSLLSCIGSLLILLAYWVLKELRTTAQKIITLLSVSDLLTAVGYLIAGWNFLTHFNETNKIKCDTFLTVCQAQSFITTWSTLCSFGWTVALALHFYLIVRYCKQELISKILVFENIVIWSLPTVLIVTLLATHNLGYTRYATSNWCYVTDTLYPSSDLRDSGVTIGLMLVAGNLWELISYIAVISLYTLTRREYNTKVRMRVNSRGRASIDTRLLLIPLAFVLLRMWGTVQFFFSIATSHLHQDGCVPHWVATVYYVLGLLQAIGDSGQGWGNALLYIFLSSTIRQELFCSPCRRLVLCPDKEQAAAAAEPHSSTSAVNISRQDNERRSLLTKNTNYKEQAAAAQPHSTSAVNISRQDNERRSLLTKNTNYNAATNKHHSETRA